MLNPINSFLRYFKTMYITLKWIVFTYYCTSQWKDKNFSLLKYMFIVSEKKLPLKIIGLRKTSGFTSDLQTAIKSMFLTLRKKGWTPKNEYLSWTHQRIEVAGQKINLNITQISLKRDGGR